jgi:uncharacterized protein YbbC (DUF1343 family)
MKFGIDRFCEDKSIRAALSGKRVALLAHPASVTQDLTHSVDAIAALGDVHLSSAFGPQHGMRGDKQDNMVESEFYIDPLYGIPVYSLYGQVRRPTREMMDSFDVILVDLQDLGCRIYTFITTLLYVLEEASRYGKSVWVLDRPNPVGRPIEGLCLEQGWESFVGAGPMPMRHGLTLGELGHWFREHYQLALDYRVIQIEGYDPTQAPGFGWPLGQRAWVNPSPNAPNLSMARNYPGSVLLEGTTLSEGRGTTRPLEGPGAPDVDMQAVLKQMVQLAPEWLTGCVPRLCYFEPTFHKHQGKLCQGIQFHVEAHHYQHEAFKPYRIYSLFFKALRMIHPQYEIWRSFPYEYEFDRLAIDLINGGPRLREWVEDSNALPSDLEAILKKEESQWFKERRKFLLYPA